MVWIETKSKVRFSEKWRWHEALTRRAGAGHALCELLVPFLRRTFPTEAGAFGAAVIIRAGKSILELIYK